jgi:hypothetical protein
VFFGFGITLISYLEPRHDIRRTPALVIEEEVMRLDYKLAILKSGRYQFEIAHESGLSEGRLSRFIRGREQLRPEEEQRLRTVLGLTVQEEEAAHVG